MRATAQIGKVVAWVADREPWLALFAIPLLLFPEYLAPLLPLAVAMLVFLICCRLILRRPMRFASTIDVAVIVLLIMLPISFWVSSEPARSLPKLTTSLGGLFLFWSMGVGLRRERDVRAGALLLALGAAGVVAIGLIGVEWPASKILYLSRVYEILPSLVSGVPRSIRGGFHPNEVGGALAMLAPLLLGVLAVVASGRKPDTALALRDIVPGWLRRRIPAIMQGRGLTLALLIVTLAGVLFILALTQSRGALVGLAGGLAFMLILRDRRVLLLAAALAVCVVLVSATWALTGTGRTERIDASFDALTGLMTNANALTTVGVSGSSTATGRVEIWRNGLNALIDYPLTGVGLYTFQSVSWANYVYKIVSPTFQMNHTHNVYLETGVDLGIPGLLAFLMIVVVVLAKGVRLALSGPRGDVRWLACGLVGGLTATLLHGVVDSVMPLGHKPGIIFWALAGLIVAAGRLWPDAAAGATRRTQPLRRWPVALSVVAVALVALWGVLAGPVLPIARLNFAALALDQARLKPGLSATERADLLERAAVLLRDALPWRADTVYLRLGIVENERGRVEPARAYWALTPQALPYLLAQGDLRSGLGQASQASAYFAHAAALAPQSSSALYRVGQLTAAQGDASAALLRLQQAIDMDNFDGGASEKANAYAALGSVLRSQQRWGEAVQAYQQAQALASPFIWQRDLVQSMYRRDGNSVAAEAYARASIIQSPNLVEPYMGLIEVLDAEGRVDEALDVGWTAVNRFPDASAPMLYMGQVYMERGEYDKAEDLFERVVILRPRNAQLRMWLVRLALQRQQPELALAELRKGLSLMPNEATFYVAIGDIERAAGNTGAARTAYRSALAIDAQNAAAQRGLSALPD